MTKTDAASGGLDLRTGRSVWEIDARPPSPSRPLQASTKTDVIIIGAGITGAFIADRLAAAGREVLVLDRRKPQRASTAASTALLQWEIDAPLLELEDRLGFDAAAAIYRRSFDAVRGIARLCDELGEEARFAWRQTLFLAGTELDAADLREELRLRERAGIEGAFLGADELLARFGLRREGALLHPGSAEAHPMELARLLLDRAIARGARVAAPVDVTDYDCGSQGVTVATRDGLEVSGEILVLANGYEMPAIVPARRHRIVSTWALATAPQPREALWPQRALIWEASDPYCYLRTTAEGRIIIGGEDEEIDDAERRDELMPAKIAALRDKLPDFAPAATREIDAAWTGFFGETDDGLPLIGRAPGQPRCYAAFGYGGNGITFSAIAATMLERLIAGGADPAEAWFAIDR